MEAITLNGNQVIFCVSETVSRKRTGRVIILYTAQLFGGSYQERLNHGSAHYGPSQYIDYRGRPGPTCVSVDPNMIFT